MKLRPVQLACLALLLSTLRLADHAALVPGAGFMQGSYLDVLLSQSYTRAWNRANHQKPLVSHLRLHLSPAAARGAGLTPRNHPDELSASSLAALQTVWSMRPPAAHCAALQAALDPAQTA